MWTVYQADDSRDMPGLIFREYKKKKENVVCYNAWRFK